MLQGKLKEEQDHQGARGVLLLMEVKRVSVALRLGGARLGAARELCRAATTAGAA